MMILNKSLKYFKKMGFSQLFILIIQITMIMNVALIAKGFSVGIAGIEQNTQTLLLVNDNEKHQSINNQQSIENNNNNKIASPGESVASYQQSISSSSSSFNVAAGSFEIERNADNKIKYNNNDSELKSTKLYPQQKENKNEGLKENAPIYETAMAAASAASTLITIQTTTELSNIKTAPTIQTTNTMNYKQNELPSSSSSSLLFNLNEIPTTSGITTTSSSSFLSTLINGKNEEIYECGSPEYKTRATFDVYDYTIVLAMLVISLGIGVFYGFFHKSGESESTDFLLGSEMKLFPVTLSLTTSFITAIELLGNPSEMFYQGTQFSLIVIPMVLVIPVAIKMFYPIYYKLDLTSCYEYLGIRFGRDIRIMGAVLYIIQMCFYTAVAVLAPAIALSKATGLNTRLAVILIYMVCVFYSSQGGMKAVVIADTFQACVLAFSLVLIVILGSFYSGGITEIFETAHKHNRLEFLNFDPDPTKRHTVFSVVIGGFFYWASLFCTNQASVQKCMSLKSLKLAKQALGFAILGLIVVFLINFYTGLMVFTHYVDCDPLKSGQIEAGDQLLPYYIMNVYNHIYTIAGIFVAGIFAASLGTVASALNSLAAVTCEDILVNGFNIKLPPAKGAIYAKWMSLGYGILSFILVFIVEKLGGVLQATLTLNGLVGGVTLGLFVLGIAFKRANAKGAFYGGIIALVIVIYLGLMALIKNTETKMLPTSIHNCSCLIKNNTFEEQQQDMLMSNETSQILSLFYPKENGEILLTKDNNNSNNITDYNNVLIMIKDKIINDTIRNQNDNNNNNNNNNMNNNCNHDGSCNSNHNLHQIISSDARKINDNISSSLKDNDQQEFSIYNISYMWYSMIGTLLTIFFGLTISIICDAVTKHKVLKITKNQEQQQQKKQKEQEQMQNHQQNLNGNNFVSSISNGGNNSNGGHKSIVTISKLNENLRAHYTPENQMSLQQTSNQNENYNQKSGIDNYALKIDDEK